MTPKPDGKAGPERAVRPAPPRPKTKAELAESPERRRPVKETRMVRVVLAVVVAAAALGFSLTGKAAPSAIVVSPGGSGCPAACPDFQSAYKAAQASAAATVVCADGTYPAQTINGTGASLVDFRAQNVGACQVAALHVNVDRIHFHGIIASGVGQSRGGLTVCQGAFACSPTVPFTDVLIDGFHGKYAFIIGHNITVDHSEFGGANACQNLGIDDAFRFWGGKGVNATPTNDRLLNSWIHAWDAGNGVCNGTVTPTPHLDCMQNQGGVGIVVRGNIFAGCPSSNIQWQPFGPGNVMSGNTVDGNYFGRAQCCNSVVFGVNHSQPVRSCPTLAYTSNTTFRLPNVGSCTGEQISGNKVCPSLAACPIPVWSSAKGTSGG